jgi:hypothetical protein
LIKLLDFRDEYMKKVGVVGGGCTSSSPSSGAELLTLSKNYRRVLRGCIQEWADDIEAKKKKKNGQQQDHQEEADEVEEDDDSAIPTGTEPSEEEMSLELLRVTDAVMQLSETFLLPPTATATAGGGDGTNNNDDSIFDYYSDGAGTVNSSLPGAVTADTVRYLRTHSLGDAEEQFDDSVLEEIRSSYQPDQYNGGKEYWELIEAHLIRGCLEGKKRRKYFGMDGGQRLES